MVMSYWRAIRLVGMVRTLTIRPLPIDLTTPRSAKVIFMLQPPPGSDVTCMAPAAGHTNEVSSGTYHHSPMCTLWVVSKPYRDPPRTANRPRTGHDPDE